MASAVNFEKRYANHETKQRTFTFVRNWKHVSENEENRQNSGVDENEQVASSPVSHNYSDNISEAVKQDPAVVIVSNDANNSEKNESENETEEGAVDATDAGLHTAGKIIDSVRNPEADSTEKKMLNITCEQTVSMKKDVLKRKQAYDRKPSTSTCDEESSSLQYDEHSVRQGKDTLDLDVVYECITETAEDMIEKGESNLCRIAVKKVTDITKKELRKCISQIIQIKMHQAQILKRQSSVKRLRNGLCELQQRKLRLKSKLTDLRKQLNVDKDLLQINRWLFDFSKFQEQYSTILYQKSDVTE